MSASNVVEHHGFWWLAAAPENRATGVLKTSEDGRLSLELAGALGGVASPGHDLPEGQHRISGTTEGARAVTLERCYAHANYGLFGGLPRQHWHVHEAMFGAVFDAVEPWAVCAAELQIPGLTAWVQPANIEQFHDLDSAGNLERMGIAFRAARLPLWDIEGTTLELVRRGGTRPTSETTTEMESRIDISIRARAAMSADELRRLARPLQMLIGLSTGIFTTAIRGAARLSPNSEDRYADWKWQPITKPVLGPIVRYGFLYSEWRDASDGRVDKWIERLDSVDPAIDLYLASLREVGYAELSFLILVQALETYHRRTSTRSVLPMEEWCKLRSCLNEAMNEFASSSESSADWRLKMLGKLQYLNEPSLLTRLEDLFVQTDSLAETVAGGTVKKFLRRIADTRNYFTHWDSSNEGNALRGASLLYASSRLQALLEILFLRDAGFDFKSKAVSSVLRRRIEWLSQ